MILLTPGPCQTSKTVREAAAAMDMNHRDPAFLQILLDVRQRLLRVYAGCEDFLSYVIGGSGTAAVEAMITSFVGNGRVLIVENGYYSGRIGEILRSHKIPFESVKMDWLSPFELQALESKLTGGFEAVLLVHNETTTGRLNPLQSVSRLCRQHGCRLLVDAMSSFGADDIDFEGVDAVASSANKCLHGLPGVSFVLAKRNVADQLRLLEARSFYLHLPRYESDSPPMTPPVSALLAFQQALIELGPEGGRGRKAGYSQRAERIRSGLKQRGFTFAIDEGDMSCTLTTAKTPDGWSAETWLRANREAGFMLYGTKGTLAEDYFQVANMGELSDTQIELWLANVDDLLSK